MFSPDQCPELERPHQCFLIKKIKITWNNTAAKLLSAEVPALPFLCRSLYPFSTSSPGYGKPHVLQSKRLQPAVPGSNHYLGVHGTPNDQPEGEGVPVGLEDGPNRC